MSTYCQSLDDRMRCVPAGMAEDLEGFVEQVQEGRYPQISRGGDSGA